MHLEARALCHPAKSDDQLSRCTDHSKQLVETVSSDPHAPGPVATVSVMGLPPRQGLLYAKPTGMTPGAVTAFAKFHRQASLRPLRAQVCGVEYQPLNFP
jgi:hypothetical protein